MKYTAKLPDQNYNVSDRSQLMDAAQLVGGIALVCIVGYFLLGVFVDIGAKYVPYEVEDVLSGIHESLFQADVDDERVEDLQKLVDRLASSVDDYSDYPDGWFKVSLVSNPEPNAFATTGGQIYVFSGLLEYAESEQELAMVLGHEIGHIVNRDPIRLFGRGLFLLFAAILVGSDNYASEIYNTTLSAAGASFSREQERNADEMGIDILHKVYGHVGGAEDFFVRLKSDDKYSSELPEIASTHPIHENRINFLRQLMIDRQYPVRPTTVNPFRGARTSNKSPEDWGGRH